MSNVNAKAGCFSHHEAISSIHGDCSRSIHLEQASRKNRRAFSSPQDTHWCGGDDRRRSLRRTKNEERPPHSLRSVLARDDTEGSGAMTQLATLRKPWGKYHEGLQERYERAIICPQFMDGA